METVNSVLDNLSLSLVLKGIIRLGEKVHDQESGQIEAEDLAGFQQDRARSLGKPADLHRMENVEANQCKSKPDNLFTGVVHVSDHHLRLLVIQVQRLQFVRNRGKHSQQFATGKIDPVVQRSFPMDPMHGTQKDNSKAAS